jgi:hypothetical protein
MRFATTISTEELKLARKGLTGGLLGLKVVGMIQPDTLKERMIIPSGLNEAQVRENISAICAEYIAKQPFAHTDILTSADGYNPQPFKHTKLGSAIIHRTLKDGGHSSHMEYVIYSPFVSLADKSHRALEIRAEITWILRRLTKTEKDVTGGANKKVTKKSTSRSYRKNVHR